MGKRTKQRKTAVLFDSDDEGSVSSTSTAMSDLTLAETDQKKIPPPETEEDRIKKDLDDCLDALYEKRGATREKALTLIVDSFRNKLQHQFVANKFITILHQCLNSVKKGSSKEIHLASLAIGLLAITVGCDDSATHELLEESVTPLSQALKSGSESLKISSILDCLAVITFIGGICPDETERAMQMIWQFVRPKSGPNVVATKPTVTVLTAAISAWAFLFTSMDGWKINSKESQESLSYLSTLLDKEDRSVRMAAGEAIAVIFEVGNLDRLHREAKSSSGISASEGNGSVEGYQQIQGLKAKILDQVRNLSVEAGGKGSAKKDLNTQKNLFKDVAEFLEDGYPPETSMKVGGDVLKISTWSQLIQMNFLKRFLAGSFAKHILENEFLHDVFGFDPKKKQPSGSANHLSSDEKRLFKSPNSVVNKARTQYLNKTRMLSQGRNVGHFSVGGEDEDA